MSFASLTALGRLEPKLGRVFVFSVILSTFLFLRPQTTNFVFDEQEALLANPYLRGDDGLGLWDAFRVDFWGLSPERTIGSYRPLPNLMWRLVAPLSHGQSPFAFLLVNLLVHAATCALFVRVLSVTVFAHRGPDACARVLMVWWTAAFLSGCGLSTEAVCSAVGLADLLVGLSTALALSSVLSLGRMLSLRQQWRAALQWGVLCVSATLGCFSKESMVGSLLFLPVAALWVARHYRLRGQLSTLLVVVVLGASVSCLIGYVWTRNSFFPAATARAATFVGSAGWGDWVKPWFVAFGPPLLPDDPMNNPLLVAPFVQRIASAMAIFGELFSQVFVPLWPVADSSYPRLLPHEFGWSSWWGVALGILLFGLGVRSLLRFSDGALALRWGGLFAWGVVCTYLPVSNLFVLLPTIRAERLFYTPTMYAVLVAAALLVHASNRLNHLPAVRAFFALSLGGFLVVQYTLAKASASRYRDDLTFWRSAAQGDPPSAKSLLNWGIMLGARGDLNARLRLQQRAVQLAPEWAMGQVYLGDAYCRLGDLQAAREPYLKGLALSPNSKALASLALQCLWESGAYPEYRDELQVVAQRRPDGWLDYLLAELDHAGEVNDGIPEQHRPRSYNRPE